MKYNPLTRRMFLQGSAGALAIPFLPSLITSRAEAAGVSPIKFIQISTAHCLPREETIPLYHTPDVVPWIAKEGNMRYQSLASIVAKNGAISNTLHSKWNPYVSKMNVITNAYGYLDSVLHSSSIMTTASNGTGDNVGPLPGYFYSVDYLFEQYLARIGASTLIPTLRVNLLGDFGGYDFLSYGTTSSGEEKKFTMLKTLSELKQKITPTTTPDNTVHVTRRKLIDSVLSDFTSLMNHKRISSVDKQRLSDAADLWNQFDNRLIQLAGKSCQNSTVNTSITGDENWDLKHAAAMDGMVLALKCGLTRNISTTVYQGANAGISGFTLHGWEHDMRDDLGNIPDIPYRQVCQWRGEKVVSLLDKLSAVTDENGQPLINSTLVSWTHEYATWGHCMLGYTMIVAGGANGKLDMGYHVDVAGAPINQFHLTNLKALGLTQSEIEKNGLAGFGEYSSKVTYKEQDLSFGMPGKFREYEITSSLRNTFLNDVAKRKALPYLKG